MKNLFLYMSFIAFLVVSCADYNEFENSKSLMTRAISPDEFDWETVDVMPTPSCQSTINLPWDGAGSLATTYGSDKLYDFKKEDGWTLVYNTFTSEGNAPLVNPYFILYNKYNGLLRVYLYTTTQFVTTSSTIESTVSVNDSELSILNFLGSEVLDGSINQNSYNALMPAQIDGGSPLASNKWYMMQYEMAYDPNLANKSNVLLNLNLKYYDVTNFKFTGNARGTINGTIGVKSDNGILNNLITNGKSSAAAVLSGVGVKFIDRHTTAGTTDGSNDLGLSKSLFSKISAGVTKAMQSSVQGIPGSIVNFVSGIVSGGGASTQSVNLNFAVDSIRIEGTGTNSGSFPSMPITIKIPGTSTSTTTQGVSPLFTEPLGIFNFIGKPQLRLNISHWKRNRYDDPMQPGVMITETESYLNIPQNDYTQYIVVNPSVLDYADIEYECDLVAVHEDGYMEVNPTSYSAYDSGEYGSSFTPIPRPNFHVRCIVTVSPKNGEAKYYIHKWFEVSEIWNETTNWLQD